MATATLVITYTGTVGSRSSGVEVQSFTHAGTAYASISEPNMILSRILMLKAAKLVNADYGSTWAPEGDHT